MTRLLALLAGLSTATDLGAGAPMEESVKRAVLAYRLARSMGCPDLQVREVLYASLLLHLGCTAFAHELADVFGDDAGVVRAAFAADGRNQREAWANLVSLTADATGRTRAGIVVTMLTEGRRVDRQAPVATCEVARDAARRLGLPVGVEHDLAHVTTQWNGPSPPDIKRYQEVMDASPDAVERVSASAAARSARA